MDRLFLDAYRTRRDTWTAAGPVVVVLGSRLVLHRAGQRDTARVIPDVYHALKAVAHLPFAIYLTLAPAVDDRPLPDETRAALAAYPVRIDSARPALGGFGLSPEQVARQHAILDRARAFVVPLLGGAPFDRAALARFAAELGPLMLANAAEAGCAQVHGTHQQMLAWKAAMSPEEWDRLVVISQSGHQARYRNAGTQYFAWLLREEGPPWSLPGESMRVLYAESLRPNETALHLGAAVAIDADASRAFFGDEWRLSEDILSDGAVGCISQLPPLPSPPSGPGETERAGVSRP